MPADVHAERAKAYAPWAGSDRSRKWLRGFTWRVVGLESG
jgi:hypothetical protein